MKLALIGATGFVGAKVRDEALARGHEVTAIVRAPQALPTHPRLTAIRLDVHDADALAKALAGHDAVISAFNPGRMTAGGDEVTQAHVAGHTAILAAVKGSGVKRFLAVGGAASLKTPDGLELLDSPAFPKEYEPFKGGIRGTRALYYLLREEPELDWVFLAPSAFLLPGERTGRFRLGKDNLLVDADGQSRISLEDYAMALIDEAERPAHHRERFTVGY
jgi:putative NADH-flavin reductase